MRPIKEYQEWRLHESVRLRKNASNRSRLKMAEDTRDPELLDLLSQDLEWSVRVKVASNPNSTPEILNRLSRDEDQNWFVRAAVARNPNSTVETLKRLSRDPDTMVRWTVAENPNTPIETLVALSMDQLEEVRSTADDRLSRVKAERPELRDRIEELENLVELGIRGDEEAPDLSDLDI